MSNTVDKTQNPAPEREAEGERDDAFLRRWSRRKHEARTQEAAAPADIREPQAPLEPTGVSPAPVKVLTDADMPSLESLDENSDFSMFLSAGVSDALRGQALRKLFLLPGIRERCPLDSEYYDCHGYTPLGNIVTHEMREEMEREAQKLKDAAMSALMEEKSSPAEAAATPVPETAPTAAAAPETTSDEAAPENAAAADPKDETSNETPT